MASAKEIQNRKVNARLYPIYKMISWDLLFYYSIIYLFLTQAKGFKPLKFYWQKLLLQVCV